MRPASAGAPGSADAPAAVAFAECERFGSAALTEADVLGPAVAVDETAVGVAQWRAAEFAVAAVQLSVVAEPAAAASSPGLALVSVEFFPVVAPAVAAPFPGPAPVFAAISPRRAAVFRSHQD